MNYLDVMRAREMARLAHAGQLYGKLPYMYHLDMVANFAQGMGFDEETVIVAYLHDSIEDGVLTYANISREFGSSIADDVRVLSRDKDDVTYTEYINQVNHWGGRAKNVKLSDLICNLRECFSNPSEKNNSLAIKYQRAIMTLAQ